MGLQLETQEVGTGKWFPIVQYLGDEAVQRPRAEATAETMQALGLYARVTPAEGES